MSAAAAEWGRTHPERCKRNAAACRERNREAIRAKDRQKIASDPEPNRRRVREWKSKNPVRHLAQAKRWAEKNPERMALANRAAYHVRAALRKGVLVRPITCQQCGAERARIEASHDDYSKPLAVTWLCQSCHRRKDAKHPNTKGAMDRRVA